MDGHDPRETGSQTTRRAVLAGAAGATLMGALARGDDPSTIEKAAKKGRIKQSLVQWCYAPYFDMPQMIKVAKDLGCGSIELGRAEVLSAAEGARPDAAPSARST